MEEYSSMGEENNSADGMAPSAELLFSEEQKERSYTLCIQPNGSGMRPYWMPVRVS